MYGSLPSQLISVQDLFAGSLFDVPAYQRAYAWEQKQWDDLWEDIREGLRTGTPHFLGTVVLMEKKDEPFQDREGRSLKVFDIVDGQQRLTTLCLLLLALYERVRCEDDAMAHGLWHDFIEHQGGRRKLRLGGLNAAYFESLVSAIWDGQDLPSDQSSTNLRLKGAVRRFRDLIDGWQQADGVKDLVRYVRNNLHVLRFVPDSRTLAIKTFHTVNDRGKELSLLDKTKGFLMFYVTRYLPKDEDVFHAIDIDFARVFDNYDTMRDLASKYKVDYLINPRYRFSEDELLRYAYHYGYHDLRSKFGLEIGYEYYITPERVFDSFVKRACHDLRERPNDLRDFILSWCSDLVAVSDALVALLRQIPDSPSHKRLFQFQSPHASVYPLLVTAQARGILDEQMLKAISILDLRVYQVRGTDPKADLYRNAVAAMKNGDRDSILATIYQFCSAWGNDQELDSILRGRVADERFAKYILWSFAVDQDREIEELDYELYANCQVEHILSQEPSTFDVTTFGFKSREDYESSKHGFGNLTVLEEKLNKRAQNLSPTDKAAVYANSCLAANRVLGTRIQERGFGRSDQVERTDAIVRFFRKKWPIPGHQR